nr:Fic/DOC family N-terminal domain-containing protein [uncultured Dyadobacter sp.]
MLYPINPDRNIPWNDLPELPISEELYRNIEVYEALANAKAALGRLQGRSIAIPNQAILINTISLQEAKASSAIENIFTTDDELYKAFSEQGRNEITGSAKDVLRYREALWFGHSFLRDSDQFSEDYFRAVYQEIYQTTDGIRPPFVQTHIRQGGSSPNAGKPVYTPPRGVGIIETKLSNLVTFLNDDKNFRVDPVIKMAIGHFQFEAIHPFRDGNGRTGRIFNINYLTHKGLLDYPILFLSRFILDNREDYYGGLMGVSQRGDWNNWLRFMLKAVETTAIMTYDKINDILNTKDAIRQVIISDTAIARPELLVNAIFTQPFTRVKHLTDQRLYAENTAKKYLNQLVDLGVLEKRAIQGNHYYLNLELYRILAE